MRTPTVSMESVSTETGRGGDREIFNYDVSTMESGDVSLQPSLVEFFERPVPRPSGNYSQLSCSPPLPVSVETAYSIHAEGRPILDVDDVGRSAIEPFVLRHVVQQLSKNGPSLVRGSIPSGRSDQVSRAPSEVKSMTARQTHNIMSRYTLQDRSMGLTGR